MARSAVRRIDPPNARRLRDALVTLGIILILLFALVGVVSAGIFVGGKVAGGTKAPLAKQRHHTSTRSAAVQDIARAQVQATHIVLTAHRTRNSIIASATKKARAQSRSIVSQARKQAAAISKASVSQGSVAATSSGTSGAPSVQSTTAPTATLPFAVPTPIATSSIPSTTSRASASGVGSTTPNLSGVPSSWLVVGYNATFGSGPGSAGGVSVINRSRTPMSGTVKVAYTRGGFATATFAGLASGQSEVLALNGSAYRGGGYRILLLGVR